MAGGVRNPRIVRGGEKREEVRRGMKKGSSFPSEIILFLIFFFQFGLCACMYLEFAGRLLPVSLFVCFEDFFF